MYRAELIRQVQFGAIPIATDGAGPQSADSSALTAFVVTNSIVILMGRLSTDTSDSGRWCSVKIKDTTHVTGYAATGTTGIDTLYFCVVEFHPNVIFNAVSGIITTSGSNGAATVTVGTRRGVLLPAFLGPDQAGKSVYLSIAGTTVTLNNPYSYAEAGPASWGFNYFEM